MERNTDGIRTTPCQLQSLHVVLTPAMIVNSSLTLKCSQMTGLPVFKSRYDILEKVKSSKELRETSPGKQRASSVLPPYPERAVPSLHSQASATNPLPGLQVCPSPGTRCPPLSCLASHMPSLLASISHQVPESPGASTASCFCAALRCKYRNITADWGGRGKAGDRELLCSGNHIPGELLTNSSSD